MSRDDRYVGDVWYEVWRHGGDPDAVDRDRVSDYEYDGYSAEEAARAELDRQRPVRHEEQEQDDATAPEPEGEVKK